MNRETRSRIDATTPGRAATPRRTAGTRGLLRMLLAVTLTMAGVPAHVGAAPEVSSVRGTAYTAELKPVARMRVQIRNLRSAAVVASSVSGPMGDYSFANLQPGDYLIELVNGESRVVGMSAPFRLDSGASVMVSVVLVADGTVASGNNAGVSLFGMGPTATLAVLGAAGAVGVTALVANRQDASPSR